MDAAQDKARGVEVLSAAKGPVTLVTEAVSDARGDTPPKPIFFLTEEEIGGSGEGCYIESCKVSLLHFAVESCLATRTIYQEPGLDYTTTVRMTLQSLAAQMDVGAAHLRFQDQQAGWLLLEDTLDESLKTLEISHPQLQKRLDAMMELAARASRSSSGSALGPPVLVAVHCSFRRRPTSFCSLLHLVPKASRLAAKRVFVSWPVGLLANISAAEEDLKRIKDEQPESAHENLGRLCCLHALLQHKSRMGEVGSIDSSWLTEVPRALLKSKPETRLATDDADSIALCKDVLSNSWPGNLWAVLPELASDLDESLDWSSLQETMQEALQKQNRRRGKRSSRIEPPGVERRVYRLLWRSQSVET
eukprot:Skav204746  [mRNA]  locus=scaffold1013:52669:54749:- [translate_table: standard]